MQNLGYRTVYKLWFVVFLLVVFMAGCEGGQPAPANPPVLISTNPADGATDVPLNQKITATFNQSMDPVTITTVIFTVMQGATPVAGTVTYSGTTATFSPAGNLLPNTTYTATVATGAKNVYGEALAAGIVPDPWSFTTGATPDTTAPTIISTNPANTVTGVSIDQAINATFSEAMDPATITTATFTLMQGATPVAGTVTYSGITATFTPTSPLLSSTTYTATISAGAKDLAGNALADGIVPNPWSFTTGLTPDTTAPVIIATNPVDAVTGVSIDQSVTVTFSEAMAPSTITTATFTLMQGATPVAGTVTYSGTTATFTPTSNLLPNTTYTATVSSGAKDLAGNTLIGGPVPNPWTFVTGSAPDNTPPTIVSTNPAAGATGVAINSTINATFSEAMDPATIDTGTFTVTGPPGATPVSGSVTYNAITHIATFTPTGDLELNATYTALVSTGATDLAGNVLVGGPVPNPWSFTTASTAPPTNQSRVTIGDAEDFAVLAGTVVTNSGPTTITGNVGTSPGSTITGFPPGTVNGAMHANDEVAREAHNDLISAFNDATGRTGAVVVANGELGGLTLAPGIYASDVSSFSITSSDLILDALGAPNAVFIFQMSSSLTVATNRRIILRGGAGAENIFWQVGSTVNLGTNSQFAGNILSAGSITLQSGAILRGRALTTGGAVILDTVSITGTD